MIRVKFIGEPSKHLLPYAAGTERDLPDQLAEHAIKMGVAVLAEAATKPKAKKATELKDDEQE